jgi:AbrB family looped-hinge helix DNA binding protein
MSKMRVSVDKQNKASVYIPAFLRDKFDIKNGDMVEVDTDGARIIMTKVVEETK